MELTGGLLNAAKKHIPQLLNGDGGELLARNRPHSKHFGRAAKKGWATDVGDAMPLSLVAEGGDASATGRLCLDIHFVSACPPQCCHTQVEGISKWPGARIS